MNKAANPNGNSVTDLGIPLFRDINNRRFVTAVLAGVLGGAGVSSAANLLRQFREMRQKKTEETDADTIVLTLPPKAAADGYTSMRDAKSGESKPTANTCTQMREAGKFGAGIKKDKADAPVEKTAQQAGNPGPNTVGTIVANALGLTAGGLLSYEVVSRLFDKMNERRLKRKLEAAQQAYVDSMTGASKRAEAINRILGPVEHVICKSAEVKEAMTPGDILRYPTAAYILALLAGTGATAYVTKKVMDREFPEEKLKKDINRPTRIVFRTAPGTEPTLSEGAQGEEKAASAETCAALTAMLPIYMDAVEGQPARTLAAPYVKLAEAAGTDPAGLMKMALTDMSRVYSIVLSDPQALWAILRGTNFGLNFSKQNAINILRTARPDTYRRAVDAAIDARFANSPNAGFFQKGWNKIQAAGAKFLANHGGRDKMVDAAVGGTAAKTAEADSLLRASYLGSAILGGDGQEPEKAEEPPKTRTVISKAKQGLKAKRKVTVEAADPTAAAFLQRRKDVIQKLLAKLNAQGTI